MKNKRIKIVLLMTAFILSIPLVAMQFTDEMKWGVFDFVIAGVMLLGTGLAYELLVSRTKTASQKYILAAVLAIVLTVIWAQLAVGIF